LIVRPLESSESGGLGFVWKPGALGALLLDPDGAGVTPLVASLLDVVLLTFGLENIPGCLYEFDRVDGLIVDPDLIVNLFAGAVPRAAHIRNAFAPRGALHHLIRARRLRA
jgi:hypothetical protein